MKEFCELLLNFTKIANLCGAMIPQTCGTYDRLAVYKQPEKEICSFFRLRYALKHQFKHVFECFFEPLTPFHSFMKKPGEATLKQPTLKKIFANLWKRFSLTLTKQGALNNRHNLGFQTPRGPRVPPDPTWHKPSAKPGGDASPRVTSGWLC